MVSPTAFARTLVVAAFAALLAFAPAHAQQVVTVTTTTVTWTYDGTEGDDGADYIGEDAALLDDAALAGDADFAAARRYAPSATLATLGQAKTPMLTTWIVRFSGPNRVRS